MMEDERPRKYCMKGEKKMGKQKRKSKINWKGFCFIAISFIMLVNPCLGAEDPDKFPSKPITMIVQWTAGGTTDLTARRISELASKILGQPIVVENKVGGSGVIGAAAVANAAPDGYTVGTATWSAIVFVPHLRPTPYNPKGDFKWIMQYAEAPQLFGVLGDSRWKTFKDFIEEARRNPGKLTYASAGPLSGGHIFMEQVYKTEDVKVTHVPVGGGAEAVTKLLGGHLDAAVVNEMCSHAESGKIRPMAFQSEKRFELMPHVPTFWDLGYKIETPVWFGLYAPKGLDPRVFKKLYNAFMKAYEDPSFKKLLVSLYMMPFFRDSESFTERVIKDYDTQGRIMKEFGFIK